MAMSDYDGFKTVTDPMEYLNAPAMIMTGSQSPPPSSMPGEELPLIVRAAIDYAANLRTLSADDLQSYYAEQKTLGRKIDDIHSRIGVEKKMREAAESIGHLSINGGGAAGDDKASIKSAKPSKRLSKFLGQDGQSKAEKRLSKQAAEEVALSVERLNQLQTQSQELETQKAWIDRIISEHHCGVMSKALSGKPLPNHHRRNLSASSAISAATSQSQGSRRSWVVAPKHQRQYSSASNGDSSSLATVTEHPATNEQSPRVAPRSDPSNDIRNERNGDIGGKLQHTQAQLQQSQTQLQQSQSHLEQSQVQLQRTQEALENSQSQYEMIKQEVDSLVVKISQALPELSPAMNGPMAYVTSAFEHISRQLYDSRNHADAIDTQLGHTKSRIGHLEKEVQFGRQVSSSSDQAAIRALTLELGEQKQLEQKWRAQVDVQRKQLEQTTASLEDVTKLAVQLEGSKSQLERVFTQVQSELDSAREENAGLLMQKLGNTKNTSLLCQEFRTIVDDLVAKHKREVNSLYPLIKKKEGDTTTESIDQKPSPRPTHMDEKNLEKGQETPMQPLTPSDPAEEVESVDTADTRPDTSQSSESSKSVLRSESVQSSQKFVERKEPTPQNLPPVQNGHFNPQRTTPLKVVADDIGKDRPEPLGLGLQNGHAGMRQNTLSQFDLPTPNYTPADRSSFDTSSFDNSIQHTNESLMRPSFSRRDTEMSDVSKSSSFYPESQANPSLASIARKAEINASSASLNPERAARQIRQEYDDELL